MITNSSGYPMTKWAQRKDHLLITFCLEDCQETEVKFHRDKIIFYGCGGSENNHYDVKLELFKEIEPEKCRWQQTSRSIFVHAEKKEAGPFWPRLLRANAKHHWLKIDFEKMKDEDDSDSDDADELAQLEREVLENDETQNYLTDVEQLMGDCSLHSSLCKDQAFERLMSKERSENKQPSEAQKNFLHNKLIELRYSHPVSTEQDAIELLSAFPNLRPEFKKSVTGIGKVLLCLSGTIPVMYKGQTYNLPLAIWVMDSYPATRPLCYVKPTASMELRPGMHVDVDGKIRLPYLDSWTGSYTHNLFVLVNTLAVIFGQDPPVVQKSAGNARGGTKKRKRARRRNRRTSAAPKDFHQTNTSETEKKDPVEGKALQEKISPPSANDTIHNSTGARQRSPAAAQDLSRRQHGPTIMQTINQNRRGSTKESSPIMQKEAFSQSHSIPRSEMQTETETFRFFPPMPNPCAQTHLISFVKQSPEHLAKLEQELKSYAEVSLNSNNVEVKITAKQEKSGLKRQCINILREFFSNFSVQTEQVERYHRDTIGKGPTTVQLKQIRPGLTEVSVAGPSKDVAKKIHEIRECNKNLFKQKKLQKEESKPPAPSPPKVGENEKQEFGVPKWLLKYLTSKISQGRSNWPKVRLDFSSEGKIGLIGKADDTNQFCSFLSSEVVNLLNTYACEALRVPKDYHKNVIGRKGTNINKLRESYQVEVTVPPSNSNSLDILVEGKRDGVELAKADILKLVESLLRQPITKIVPIEEKLLIAVVGRTGNGLMKIAQSFKVDLFYSKCPANIHVIGRGEDVGAAIAHIEKSIQKLKEFAVLKVEIVQSKFGKLIGKQGRNIKSLCDQFQVLDIVLPPPSSKDRGIYLTGDMTAVFILFKHLEDAYSAKLVEITDLLMPNWPPGKKQRGQQSNKCTRRKESNSDLLDQSDDNVDELYNLTDNSDTSSLYTSLRSSPPPHQEHRVFEWEECPRLPMSFVIRSMTHWKKLGNFMKDMGTCSAWGRVEVLLDVTGLSYWAEEAKVDECRSRLEIFFKDYSGCEMTFDPNFSIDRITSFQEDLFVEWIADEFLEISGIKSVVESKIAEYEAIKNRKKDAVFRWVCGQPHVLRFVSETSTQLEKLKKNLASASSLSITEKEVVISEEIHEFEEKVWQKKCKKKLQGFFGNYATRVIQFHPLSSVERTDCIGPDLRVTWTGNKTSVIICGLKSAIDAKAATLEMAKNRKKSVSYKWRITERLLLEFTKESPTQLQDLQDSLKDLGSPVFSDVCIVVNGEIMEISSVNEWEDKCRKELMQFYQKYLVDRIEVPPLSVPRASQLGENQQEVITKWADDQNSLVIFGLQTAVKRKVTSLRKTLQQIEAEEQKAHIQAKLPVAAPRPSITASLSPQANDEAIEVFLRFKENKLKCLQAHAKNNEFPNVDLEVLTSWNRTGISLKGLKSDVLKAKAFAQSIVVEELVIEKYGVYELLTENSILMEVIGVKFNCTLLVEQIENQETDDEAFELVSIEDLPSASVRPVYGRLSVYVEEGDITDESVDMIVNTTDKAFGFSGPLSRAILAKAGNSVFRECRAASQQDDIIVSGAGRLNCARILHVALPGPHDRMDALIEKILARADLYGARSLTMPTIGAGGGGWPCHEIAKSMHEGIVQYSKLYPSPRKLRIVKIMLFPAMSYFDKQEFYKNINNVAPLHSRRQPTHGGMAKKPAQPRKGWLNKVFNYFSSDPKVPSNAYSTLAPSLSSAFDGSYDMYEVQESNVDRVLIKNMKTTSGESAKVLFSSNDSANVEKAKAEVSKVVELHLKEFELNDKAISRLKQVQIETIKKISMENNVRITIDTRKDKHTVKIQGRDQYASKAHDEVRKIISTISSVLPDHWLHMTKDKKVIKVELSRSSTEYNDVLSQLEQSNSSGAQFYVLKVERVQNPVLYQQYQLRKDEITRHVKNTFVEQRLFHGTTEDTVDKICATGFDRGYAGKNATMYGRGVYFSSLSSYSTSYATPSWDGVKYMFLADVLTGDYCVGSPNMPAPPSNPETGQPYDSTVDSKSYPTIFVVFKDASVFPSYIIKYRSY